MQLHGDETAEKNIRQGPLSRSGKIMIHPIRDQQNQTANKHERTLPYQGIAEFRVGLDLVGIGDFFGPIVVAGAALTASDLELLSELQLEIPTKWTPKKSFQGIARIYQVIPRHRFASVVISARRYNELIHTMPGRNRVIAWAHAHCIQRLVAGGNEAGLAIASDFGDVGYVRERMQRGGHELQLLQMPHAERDLAVVAASFVAHARLINARKRMSKRYGFRFPSGARGVKEAARSLIARYGPEILGEVAKMDFRTAQELDFPAHSDSK
jgi:ribonuclease HIII